jgi:hypothetical protein
MTRDPAAQAVHERLEGAVASMPTFDVEAGWASLAAKLEPPIAPVIPLHRKRPHRAVVLGIAAAVVIGGSALAAVRHGDAAGLSVLPRVTMPSGGLIGPHLHPAFSGEPATGEPATGEPGGSAPAPGGSGGAQAHHGGGGDTPASDPAGGPTGSGEPGGSPSPGGGPNQDSPDDIDHGSGNDGEHDDNGGGNDAGQDSHGQGSHGEGSEHGHGNGGNSDGTSADRGSGEHGSGDHGSSGAGHGSSH